MREHAPAPPRERPLRAPRAARLRHARLARALRLGWNDYETEARPAVEALIARPPARLPRARPALRRLADRARALRAAAEPLGRRRARGLPAARPPLPARLRRARGVAVRADARRSAAAARAGRRARSDRRQPDHAAGPRNRPPRGAARRRARASPPCSSPGALPQPPPRARDRRAARPRDREQAVGACSPRARSCSLCPRGRRLRAARSPPLGVAAVLQAPLPARLAGNFTTAARSGSVELRDLPAVAALLVPRPPRRARARPLRRRQARLPRGPALDGHVSHPLVLLSGARHRARSLAAHPRRGALDRTRGDARARADRCSRAACSTPGTPATTCFPSIFALLAWEVSGDARRPPVARARRYARRVGAVPVAARTRSRRTCSRRSSSPGRCRCSRARRLLLEAATPARARRRGASRAAEPRAGYAGRAGRRAAARGEHF